MSDTALMETYRRLPVAFERGEGAWLIDTEGNRYLDALTGLAVCGLGHAHPEVARAISEQAHALLHTSNLYEVPLQSRLAEVLCELSGMEKVFFGNSGAEANEAAIKVARLYGHQQDIEVPHIIVMDGAFHGRTMATLTATGNRKVQAGFEPLVAGFVRAPYNDLEAVRTIATNHDNVVAVLVEPVIGEGGIVIPDPGYLPGLREICDANGWLLMLDEIQTGSYRTGTPFAYQGTTAVPDVVTVAKGLANGVPIGACLARGKAAAVLGPGNHGSTFGGNPLAAAAALATLEVLARDHLGDRATQLGGRITGALAEALAGDNRVVEIRNSGLMIGVEFADPMGDLVQKAIDAGLLINVTADRVVRMLPPLTLSDEEADEIVRRLVSIL